MSIYNITARFYHTVGTLFTWLRILYMCTFLNCIGWRVKSRRILSRVVDDIGKKFFDYNEFLTHKRCEPIHKNLFVAPVLLLAAKIVKVLE